MKTDKVRIIEENNPDPALINQTVSILKKGGIVVAPTETLYGLLTRADDIQSVDRLYQVKNRPKEMPCALFVNSYNEIWEYGAKNDMAAKLAVKFLPGPLTLILKSIVSFPDQIVISGKIGVRFSPSKLIGDILGKLDFPLTATSANLSGGEESDSIAKIIDTFGDKIDFYLDSGVKKVLPSTVVDCSSDLVKILREGAITNKEIYSILGI